MRWLEDDPPLARCAILALAVGFAGNAYFLLGLVSPIAFSVAGLLFPIAAFAGLAAITAIGVREMLPPSPGARFAFLGACGGLALAIGVLGLVPPVARDELTHHLALPALYVEAGRIIEVPFADQGYYPMLLEMFYAPLLAWTPDQTPKGLHLFFALASAAVVGLAAKRLAGVTAAAIAFALILFTPVVALLAATAYVDLGLLFFTAVAIAALLRWYASGKWSWLVVSALAAGFSSASKYNGLVSIALLSVGAALKHLGGTADALPEPVERAAPRRTGKRSFAAAVLGTAMRRGAARSTDLGANRREKPGNAAPSRLLLAALAGAVYFAVALVPLSPWLAKNYVQTANPTFPLFRGVFGGRALPDRPGLDVFSRRRWLYEESWLEIAAIPVRIFTTGREGDPSRFDGVLCPLMLLGVAFALRRKAPREHRLLLAFAVTYFGLAFFQASLRARYIVPILPPLALITAPALAEVLRRRPVAGAGLLAFGAVFAAVHVGDKWRTLMPLAYLTGEESRAAYVARFVPEFPVIEYANQSLPADARLYLAFLGTRSYYCRRPFLYDYYFSGVTLRLYVESSGDPGEVLKRFRGEGITHMVAADELLGRYLTDNLDTPALERWQMFAAHHLTRETSAQGVSLYAIN